MAYRLIMENDGTTKVLKKNPDCVRVLQKGFEASVRDSRVISLFKRSAQAGEILLNKEKNPANPANLDAQARTINQNSPKTLTQTMTEKKEAIPSLCPNLKEWQRINIPAWQRILRESQQSGDQVREEYARYMLDEVLKMSEAKENENK